MIGGGILNGKIVMLEVLVRKKFMLGKGVLHGKKYVSCSSWKKSYARGRGSW